MNYELEAKKYREQFMEDLRQLVAIPSLKDESTISDKAPFGAACRAALDKMMEIGRQAGFKVKDYDGYACVIEYGEQEESIGILGHLDIVPMGEGWHHDPLACEEEAGFVFGRGVLDDKGPVVAALTAMRIIKEHQIPMNKKIMLICGCDEESGMECMKYYCEHGEIPTISFTPDATFPVVYGEKGILNIILEADVSMPILSMHAGERPNVVIGQASAIVADFDEAKQDAFEFYLRSHHLDGSYSLCEQGYEITILGESAHGSMPYLGTNAGVHILNFVGASYQNEFLLNVAAMLEDWRGSGLHIDFDGAYMGFLTMNVGMIDIENGHVKCVLDIRYPNDTNKAAILHGVNEVIAANDMPFTYTCEHDTQPLFLDPNSSFIQTLYKVYQEYSKDTFTPALTMGGGTYAKCLPNCVAYGPEFVQQVETDLTVGGPHQADEAISVDQMMTAIAIYTAALVELGK